MTENVLVDREKLFKSNFSDFIGWFNLFLNFPKYMVKPIKKIFDYVLVSYIHINQKNIEGRYDTRCIISFYTEDNWYQIHLIKPSKLRPEGYIFGTISPCISDSKEKISNDLRDGSYSEQTWRKIVMQICDLEGNYPKLKKK